jgi:hypothetical protein
MERGVSVASASVPVIGKTVLRVPLHPVGHRCVVRFKVRHTAVPAIIQPPSTDTRVLGTHFTNFVYRR